MDSQHWVRVQEIFHAATDVPVEQRGAFVRKLSGGDARLAEEVENMLAADLGAGSLLDRNMADIACQVLDEDVGARPPKEFGPYRLKRILGEGGMGVVWLAQRTDVGSLVAIKFLPHAGLSPSRRERFTQEARTLARLTHPMIARLYDAGTLDNGTPWFAMEYVDGVSVTQYWHEHGLGIDARLKLFRAICAAILYAHGQAILHRDLKPSNILVAADGTPKVLDFGIARELQRLGDATDETKPGMRFMSPPYAAPEWVREGIVGLQTDVYSLGVILYELLTGFLPGKNTLEESGEATDRAIREADAREAEKPSLAVRKAIVSLDKAPHSADLSRATWADLDVLCLKAMHPDVDQRYASVEALLRDVDHYLANEPLEARPDSGAYRLRKFVKRNRWAVLAGCLTVLLIIGLTVGFLWRLKARDNALAEAARIRRIQEFMRNMLGGSEMEAAPSKDLRVVTLLDRGVEQAGALQADPETQSELYETLGTIYDMLGEFPKAEGLLQKAIERRKSLSGDEDQQLAQLYVELGVVSGDAGKYKDAEQYVRRGLEIEARRLPEDDLQLLDAKSELGRVLVQESSYKEAISVLESVVQAVPKAKQKQPGAESDRLLSRTLLALAVADDYAGDLDGAESVSRRALELDRKVYGKAHPEVAQLLFSLGTAQFHREQYSDAESLYRQAIEIEDGWYGADHVDTATMKIGLAKALLVEGKDDQAESILHDALKVVERAYGTSDFRVANALDSLGRIALKRGNVADAAALLKRALEIDRIALGEEHYQTAIVSSNLADVYVTEGNFSQAEPMLRNAVRVLEEKRPAGDLYIAAAREKLGRCLLGLKRYNEADQELEAAEKIYEAQERPPVADVTRVRADLATVRAGLRVRESK